RPSRRSAAASAGRWGSGRREDGRGRRDRGWMRTPGRRGTPPAASRTGGWIARRFVSSRGASAGQVGGGRLRNGRSRGKAPAAPEPQRRAGNPAPCREGPSGPGELGGDGDPGGQARGHRAAAQLPVRSLYLACASVSLAASWSKKAWAVISPSSTFWNSGSLSAFVIALNSGR